MITYSMYCIIDTELHVLAGNIAPRNRPIRPAGGDDLNHSEALQKEIENLRERLSRLSRAGRVVTGDLDLDTVLQETQLTATEYDLLAELAVNAGRVALTRRCCNECGVPPPPTAPRTIRTHLMRLRYKLGENGENPKYIFAARRVGYRMAVVEPGEPAS